MKQPDTQRARRRAASAARTSALVQAVAPAALFSLLFGCGGDAGDAEGARRAYDQGAPATPAATQLAEDEPAAAPTGSAEPAGTATVTPDPGQVTATKIDAASRSTVTSLDEAGTVTREIGVPADARLEQPEDLLDRGTPIDATRPSSQREIARPQLPAGLGHGDGARIDYAVGSQNHSFGSLMEGAVASHSFELMAVGTEELVIRSVKPTCGCTVAQVLSENERGEMAPYTMGDPIPVGRRVVVPASLHTKNKHGHQNVRINIFSNDPRGTIQLGLDAEIQSFFNVNPRFLNFGRMQLGDVQTQQATIATSRGIPIGLEIVEPTLPGGVQAELVPVNPDADGKSSRWQLSVTLGPDLLEGQLARQISLRSDYEVPDATDLPEDDHDHGHSHGNVHDEFYSALLTVSAQVVGPFGVSVSFLSMGLVRPGQVVTRSIQIESNDPSYQFSENMPRVRLVGLPIPGGRGHQEWDLGKYFSYVIRPVENRNAIDVELRLDGLPEDAAGSFRGTMLIELGHPEKKEVELTITGVCRGGPIAPRPDHPRTGAGQE